jgi:hypothetical protein
VNKVGIDIVERATGRDNRTVRRWMQDGKFPAAYYAKINKLTKAEKPLPITLFTFKS